MIQNATFIFEVQRVALSAIESEFLKTDLLDFLIKNHLVRQKFTVYFIVW